MALATYTSTVWANQQPKGVHTGNMSAGGQIIWGATSTVGDVAFLCRVPHGASIVSLEEDHTTGATTQVLKFGFDRGIAAGGAGNRSCVATNCAQATVNRRNANGFSALQISLSDADPVRYATLTAQVVSGTTTTSLIVNFTLTFRADGT